MDTFDAAKKLAELLKKKKYGIVLLEGEMGAGKTTLVSVATKHLVPNARPSSPTFTLINQYADNIYHIDLYRIKDESELYNIGFYEILADKNIVFIEWPQNAPSAELKLKAHFIVTILIANERTRRVTIENSGN